MKLLEFFRDNWRVLKIPVLTLSSACALVAVATTPIMAQDSSSVGDSIQTHLSQADIDTLTELIEIAQRNSPDVRDARDAMGITPFMDAIAIAITPKHYTTFTTDRSDATIPTDYLYRESGMDISATINPLYIIRGIQQQSSLRAHLRYARQQARYGVMESYIAYLQANQTAETAQRQFDTVIAALSETRIASIQLQPVQVPDPGLLDNNEEYVAAATELFSANMDEIMALENLAVTVGMSSEDTLAVIEEHRTAAAEIDPDSTLPSYGTASSALQSGAEAIASDSQSSSQPAVLPVQTPSDQLLSLPTLRN